MKKNYLILPTLILCLACHHGQQIRTIAYSPVASVRCSADTNNAYHYTLPVAHKGNLPLLLILDSGGNGLMAVQKSQPAVNMFPCLVVGSDLIRNSFPGYMQAIEMLINEVRSKFSAGKVYISGFSGGARMAYEYARVHPVQGILMCGAGPSANSFQELPCPVYMISGTTDFNFVETYYNPLQKAEHSLYITDYFKGSHEWPPAETLKEGLLYLIGRSTPGGKELLKNECELLTGKADSLLMNNEILFSFKAIEKAINFNPDNKKAKNQYVQIRKNPKLTEAISRIESNLMQEGKIEQAYASATVDKDSVWWGKELNQLSYEIANNSGEQKDHYLRIKGFMGILFYSSLNNLINTDPGNRQIRHILSAYRTAEPENPDVYYDYALYAMKNKHEPLSRKYLEKARSLGFKDQFRLRRDFPQADRKGQ
jgi:hypothetical protein